MTNSSRRALWTEQLTRKGSRIVQSKPPQQARRLRPLHASSNCGSAGLGKRLILGLDPSLRSTGVALIEVSAKGCYTPIFLEHWVCHSKLSFVECLGRLSQKIVEALAVHAVDRVAIEQTIYVQNFKTAHILGSVRGALVGIIAAKGIPVVEYSPLKIKKAIVGRGLASKQQVIGMVRSLLGLATAPTSDEADAAAVALCCAFEEGY